MTDRPAVCRRITDVYAAVLLSAFLLAFSGAGYGAIVECKYAWFTVLSCAYLAAVLTAEAVRLFRGGKVKLRPSFAACAAVCYLVFTVISAVFSPYPDRVFIGGSRRDGVFTITLYVFVFLALLRYLHPRRWMLYVFGGSMTVFCIISLLQFAGFNPLGLYPQGLGYADANVAYSGVYVGTAGNADIAGGIISAAVPAFIVGAVKRKSPWDILLLVPAGLCVYVTVKTDVAAAMVGFAAAALLIPAVLLSGKRRRIYVLAAAISCAAALFAVYLIPMKEGTVIFQLRELLRGRWDGGFGSGRGYIWQETWKLVKTRPLLGGGADTLDMRGIVPFVWYKPDGTQMMAHITAAHSEYLNILANQGAFALCAYLAVLCAACARWFLAGGKDERTVWGAAAAGYAVQALFGISMCIAAPYLWFALAAVCAGREEI